MFIIVPGLFFLRTLKIFFHKFGKNQKGGQISLPDPERIHVMYGYELDMNLPESLIQNRINLTNAIPNSKKLIKTGH